MPPAAMQIPSLGRVRCDRFEAAASPAMSAMPRKRRFRDGALWVAANDLAFVKLAAIRIWLRADESTPLACPREGRGADRPVARASRGERVGQRGQGRQLRGSVSV